MQDKINDIALSLINKDGKISLVKRKHKPFVGFWSFPGGTREKDESLKLAVMRETNLDVEVIKKLDSLVVKGDNDRIANLYIFSCRTNSTRYKIDFNECLDGGWFDINYAL